MTNEKATDALIVTGYLPVSFNEISRYGLRDHLSTCFEVSRALLEAAAALAATDLIEDADAEAAALVFADMLSLELE